VAIRKREMESIERFLSYLRASGRGEWTWRAGGDPPDFIVENVETKKSVAVEHTTFVWPPRAASYDHVLDQVTRRVTERIRDAVSGHWVVQVDHSFGLNAFDDDDPTLTMKNSERLVSGLTEIIMAKQDLRMGGAAVLTDPLTGFLMRQSTTGEGYLYCVRTFELDTTVVAFFQEALNRKALSLAELGGMRTLLLIDDYVDTRDTLESMRRDVVLPPRLDEVIIWCHAESGHIELKVGTRRR